MTHVAPLVLTLANWWGPVLGIAGIVSGMYCYRGLRGQAVRSEQVREELHILLRQHQTEYQDGIAQVSRGIEFLEQSAASSEDVLQGRLTHSRRAMAMQLLRAGMSPDKAASTMGMARVDLQLIAKVSRILSSQ